MSGEGEIDLREQMESVNRLRGHWAMDRFVTCLPDDVDSPRQGVLKGLDECGRLIVRGESGREYRCTDLCVGVVPLDSIWGSTREFAIRQGVRE